jgi:uncharacterized protein (TIRG00374 family)
MGSMVRRLAGIPTPVIFAGSLVVAALLLWQQGAIGDIGPAIRSADARTAITALLLYLVGLALLCLRWHWLVIMVKGRSSLLMASEAFLTSVVMNYAAPLSLALPSRALLTKRALGLTATETSAVTFWEVMADLLILSLATLLWLALGGWRVDIPSPPTWLLLVSLGLLVAGILAVITAFTKVRRVQSLWSRARSQVVSGLSYPKKNPFQAGVALAITIGFWIIQGAVIWLLLEAIGGTSPDISLVLGLTSLPILIGMLSPVPGGAGIREAAMIAVASTHGANQASVLLAALTYRIALLGAVPILFGVVRLWTGISNRFHGRIMEPPTQVVATDGSSYDQEEIGDQRDRG